MNIIKFSASEKNDIKVASVNKETEEMKYHGLTIKKRPGCKTWSTRYRLNGKQYYLCGKTQNEVIKKLKEIFGIKEKIKNKIYTFEDWFIDWVNLYKRDYVKPSTIKQYNSSVNRLSDEFKQKELTKIAADDIARELRAVSEARTKQKVFEVIKQLFDQALISDKIERNPTLAIQKPKYVRDRGVALDSHQYNKFVEVCKKYNNVALQLILFQGLRLGEALGICGEDVDLNNRRIKINKSFSQLGEFDTTKNKQSIRSIPIFEKSYELIKKFKFETGKRIFDVSQKSLRHTFDKIKIEAGLQPTLRIADLRHTFITTCQNENIPEHIIQSWVGHEIGSKVTKTTYTHVNQDANLLYINKLNQTKLYSLCTQK